MMQQNFQFIFTIHGNYRNLYRNEQRSNEATVFVTTYKVWQFENQELVLLSSSLLFIEKQLT